jgi:hypothetical protein
MPFDALSNRAAEIMTVCIVTGVPGDRDTASALVELGYALHEKLDRPDEH